MVHEAPPRDPSLEQSGVRLHIHLASNSQRFKLPRDLACEFWFFRFVSWHGISQSDALPSRVNPSGYFENRLHSAAVLDDDYRYRLG